MRILVTEAPLNAKQTKFLAKLIGASDLNDYCVTALGPDELNFNTALVYARSVVEVLFPGVVLVVFGDRAETIINIAMFGTGKDLGVVRLNLPALEGRHEVYNDKKLRTALKTLMRL